MASPGRSPKLVAFVARNGPLDHFVFCANRPSHPHLLMALRMLCPGIETRICAWPVGHRLHPPVPSLDMRPGREIARGQLAHREDAAGLIIGDAERVAAEIVILP